MSHKCGYSCDNFILATYQFDFPLPKHSIQVPLTTAHIRSVHDLEKRTVNQKFHQQLINSYILFSPIVLSAAMNSGENKN